MVQSKESAVLVLEDFDADGIKGRARGTGSKVAVVHDIRIFGLVSGVAILGANEKIVIVFIQVYDAKAVDPGVSRFFFYHGVYYLFPASEKVGISDAVFKHIVMKGPYGVARGFKDDGFNRGFLEAIALQEGVVVSKVLARQGGACVFIPDAVDFLHCREGEAGGDFGDTAVTGLEDLS